MLSFDLSYLRQAHLELLLVLGRAQVHYILYRNPIDLRFYSGSIISWAFILRSGVHLEVILVIEMR